MFVAILRVMAVDGGVERARACRNEPRGKRFLVVAVQIAVVLLIFNMTWPCRWTSCPGQAGEDKQK